MNVEYGKPLEPGDFILVSGNNELNGGWYVGRGKSGTIQFYHYREPHYRYNRILQAIENNEKLSTKFLFKSYVNTVHKWRVANIENPESLFLHNQENLEVYHKSKEVLSLLKFKTK